MGNTQTTPQSPDEAIWFGLEVQDNEGWARIEDEALGGKWWKIGTVDPLQVATAAGGGTFRAVWAPADRRRQLGFSLPFEVTAPNATPPQPQPPAPAADAPSPPPPQPPAADPPTPEPTKPRTAKTNGRAARAGADEALPQLIANADALLHPLGQTVYLHSLAQAHTDKFHTLLLQSMQVMIESERARSREHADSLKAHYKSLDDNRTELTRMILALSQQQQQAAQALATAQPSPQLGAIEAQIKDLGEQVAELADDDEEVQAAMAKLSENPNDLERALTAFQNIVGALANSPIGQALAQKLEQQPQPSHPHYDPDQ